jgi:hypothetical protein
MRKLVAAVLAPRLQTQAALDDLAVAAAVAGRVGRAAHRPSGTFCGQFIRKIQQAPLALISS